MERNKRVYGVSYSLRSAKKRVQGTRARHALEILGKAALILSVAKLYQIKEKIQGQSAKVFRMFIIFEKIGIGAFCEKERRKARVGIKAAFAGCLRRERATRICGTRKYRAPDALSRNEGAGVAH